MPCPCLLSHCSSLATQPNVVGYWGVWWNGGQQAVAESGSSRARWRERSWTPVQGSVVVSSLPDSQWCWEYWLCVIKTRHVLFSRFLFPSVASAELCRDLSLEPALKDGNLFLGMHVSQGDFPAKPEPPCVSPGSGRGKSLYTGPHWRLCWKRQGGDEGLWPGWGFILTQQGQG